MRRCKMIFISYFLLYNVTAELLVLERRCAEEKSECVVSSHGKSWASPASTSDGAVAVASFSIHWAAVSSPNSQMASMPRDSAVSLAAS